MKILHPYTDTASYITGFPEVTQRLLEEMRHTIREAAPEAEEKISYGIPTYTMGHNLVHFAGYERHIGFYPGPSGIKAFREELAAYKMAKGSVQFPLDKPLPFKLVYRIVQYRVEENTAKKEGR